VNAGRSPAERVQRFVTFPGECRAKLGGAPSARSAVEDAAKRAQRAKFTILAGRHTFDLALNSRMPGEVQHTFHHELRHLPR